MPSDAQLRANRENAKRSTGPRTPEGRARSAMNATKSGIYAKAEIIPGEDPAELDALKSQYYGSLQPVGHELDLVDEAIRAGWQLRRLARAEADTRTMSFRGDKEANLKKGLPEDQDLYVNAIADNKDTFDRLYRLQAATARVLNRSLETLLHLRKAGPLLTPSQEFGETNPIPESPAPCTQLPVLDSAADSQPFAPNSCLPSPASCLLASGETNPIPQAVEQVFPPADPVEAHPAPPLPTPDSGLLPPGSPQFPAPQESDETNPISPFPAAQLPGPVSPNPRPSPSPGSVSPAPKRRVPIFHYKPAVFLPLK